MSINTDPPIGEYKLEKYWPIENMMWDEEKGQRKTELVAIEGGGDWADASVDYLVVPLGVDIKTEENKRQKYIVIRNKRRDWDWMLNKYPYLSLSAWLIKHCGARVTTDDDIYRLFD